MKPLDDVAADLRSELREPRAEVTAAKGNLSELRGQIRSYLNPEQYT